MFRQISGEMNSKHPSTDLIPSDRFDAQELEQPLKNILKSKEIVSGSPIKISKPRKV